MDVTTLRALRRARDQIDRDYAGPLSVVGLARAAGYSRAHFIRAFHATYGETPGRFLSRRRVERACELLRSANLSVTEVCLLVGFTSLGTFSARFSERADHRALTARGVEFISEPAERPYGIEAVLRDDSGNWYSFTQRTV